MNSTLSTFNTTTEVPLSKAPNPQLLPGRWSNGCPLLQVCVHYCVCVHLDGLNAEDQFRIWVTILDNTSHYFKSHLIGVNRLKQRHFIIVCDEPCFMEKQQKNLTVVFICMFLYIFWLLVQNQIKVRIKKLLKCLYQIDSNQIEICRMLILWLKLN